MEAYKEDDLIVLNLPKQIDSMNSKDVEDEIAKAIEPYAGRNICLDASETTYISSSGLRVLLRLEKKLKKKLSLRNVSQEVNEIFSITGFSEILSIRKKEREVSVDGCEVIGKGAYGTVYRLEQDTVVKVFNKGKDSLPVIEQEQKTARQAFVKGLPTAIPFDIVRVGDQYGVVYEMIDAHNFNELVVKNPSSLKKLIPLFVSFLHSIHILEADPGEFSDFRQQYLDNLDAVSAILGEESTSKLRTLLKKMPQDKHLVHGDTQFKNIMLSDNEVRVIDMDTLGVGDPVFEFAAFFVAYSAFYEVDPKSQTEFLGIDKDTAASIFSLTLKTYLKDRPELLESALTKIRLLGYLRYIIVSAIELKFDDTINRKRILFAKDAISDLVTMVSDLRLLSKG